MGISTIVKDDTGHELVAKASLVNLNSEYGTEIDLGDFRIMDFVSANFMDNSYTARFSMNIAIHLDGPNYVSMRLDGDFDINDSNEISVPITDVLIYDTTIHYENPESCEEVYREIGEDAYLVVELSYE